MLSEEEKKAIEFIKFYQQHCLKKEKENMKQYETVNDEEFVSKNLDTVLNLITKLQKENELAKEQLKKQCEIINERNNLLVKVNRLESQIDLMAEYIATLDIDEDICMNNKINSEWCNEDYTNCKECIKQYFERKVKNVKNKR